MSAPKNAEIVKTRISEQRNCQSPELLLHCLMKENRINPTGSTVELLQEAIKLENEIDAGLDPLLEVDVILRAKSLIKKCSTSPIETHNGKKMPEFATVPVIRSQPRKMVPRSSNQIHKLKGQNTANHSARSSANQNRLTTASNRNNAANQIRPHGRRNR